MKLPRRPEAVDLRVGLPVSAIVLVSATVLLLLAVSCRSGLALTEFDEVCDQDLSGLDLPNGPDFLLTLTYNEQTIWPKPPRMSAEWDPARLLRSAINPGLGIRSLRREGITGRGVNVAVIDQSLAFRNHPEYAGKVVAYHDESGERGNTMHGPAVLSLLAGEKCGTAPGVRVYYAAKPFSLPDAANVARCLLWVIEQNSKLADDEKIRVVSVSSAPSGPESRYERNQHMWDEACARAEAQGILVLDCTSHRGFIFSCYYDAHVPDDVTQCQPGYPGMDWQRFSRFAQNPERYVLAPTSRRTVAEEHAENEFGYRYCGQGGQSWAIPYCAGVFALGWQVRPDLSPEQMRQLLFESCHIKENGARIINPVEFIRAVRKAPVRREPDRQATNNTTEPPASAD